MRGVSVPDGRILSAVAGFSTATLRTVARREKTKENQSSPLSKASPLIRREAKLEDGLSEVPPPGALLFSDRCGFPKVYRASLECFRIVHRRCLLDVRPQSKPPSLIACEAYRAARLCARLHVRAAGAVRKRPPAHKAVMRMSSVELTCIAHEASIRRHPIPLRFLLAPHVLDSDQHQLHRRSQLTAGTAIA
jgi:hypothetical protein